uniref:Protein FMC1 homolog n=1 Tax=Plectus sambesii TaxID=2011161 RepID=A0A914XJR7_9BILA
MPVVEKSVRAIPLIRSIVSELRKAGTTSTVRSTPYYKFCVGQLRGHQLTQKLFCKGPNEVEHIGETYSTYLRSTRLLQELQYQYKGGERDIEKTANLVGLTTTAKPKSTPKKVDGDEKKTE